MNFDRAMHRGGYENLDSEAIEREVRAMDIPGQSAAHHDPIFTPIFSSLLGSFGAISITSGLTVAGLASAIATTFLTFGVQHR